VNTGGRGAEQAGKIKVWDSATGRELATMKADTGAVPRLVFSPDGSRLASSGARRWTGGCLQVWDASSGKLLLDLTRVAEPYAVAGFSPDGSRLACVGPSSVISILDATTGQVQLVVKGKVTTVERTKITPDGKQLYSLDHNRSLQIWDITSSDLPRRFKGFSSRYPSIAINAEKQLVAAIGSGTAGKLDEIRVWTLDGSHVLSIDRPIGFKSQWVYRRQISMSSDGRRLVYIAGDRGTDGQNLHHDTVLAVLDVATGKEVFALRREEQYEAVALSPDGQLVAVFVPGVLLGEDAQRFTDDARPPNELRVIEVASGKEIFRQMEGGAAEIAHLSFSPKGGYLALAVEDDHGPGAVRVWELSTGRELLKLKVPPRLESPFMAFSPDEVRIALTTGKVAQPGEIKIYALCDGHELLTLKGHTSVVSGITFSRDGKRLASTEEGFGQPGVVKVWDAETGNDLLTLRGHSSQVWTAAFSPDGTHLYSAGSSERDYQGCELKVWDATPMETPR
jgi:WD40 repeat protein